MAFDVELAFEVDGRPRRFTSLRYNSSGTLIILFEEAAFSGPVFKSSINNPLSPYSPDRSIKSQKYSVHPSLHLPENVIHWTQISGEGKKFDRRIYTRAIKGKKRFALLHNHMLYSLEKAPDAHDRGAEVVVLGTYNPREFSVYYSFYLSHPECEFPEASDDFKIFQYVRDNFRLVILWSYIHFPAYPTGIWTHLPTRKEEDGLSDRERLIQKHYIDGMDERAAIFQFKYHRTPLHHLIIRHIKQQHKELEYNVPFFLQTIKSNLGFYREARTDTEEHRQIVEYSKKVYGFPLG
jgi:hypothetical protein